MTARRRPLLLPVLLALALLGGAALVPAQATTSAPTAAGAIDRPPRPSYVPPIRHVFVINIENKGYDVTWGDDSAAPYLAHHLRRMGVLLDSYYGTAHNSLPNYIAQISGQAPNAQTQADCQVYSTFVRTGPNVAPGQAHGTGCVYPADVLTLPQQMSRAGLRWRGYMQQMQKPCQHPKLGELDPTQHATRGHNYAVRHDPFMYFRSITGRKAYCERHVRPLRHLAETLRHPRRTPNLVYITPDLCRDGHDAPCANGQTGGLVRVNAFLETWAPRILASRAFRNNGMLVITADESDSAATDSKACCNEDPGPNVLLGVGPGISGPGGGRIGALVISHFTKANTWSTTPYNHYSLLGSLEEIFRLPKIGMARQPGLPVFGIDVYNNGWWNH